MITAIIIIVFLSVLIIVHELGHFLLAKKFKIFVEEFGLGLPPKVFGKKFGETVYTLNLLPFGGFVKISGENREDIDQSLPQDRVFYNLKIWKRMLIIAGGVAMNFLLGWVLISIVFWAGVPKAVFIADVAPESPAFQVGIKTNDKVLGYTKTEDFINFINNNKGKEISFNIEREGKGIEIKAVPRMNPPQGEGALGVALVESGQEKQGFFKGIWEALKVSFQAFTMIFTSIFKLIKMAVFGQGALQAVTGPIGIVKITSQASHLGIVFLLQLLALISINLAAINIFPFPALDGGRLIFLIIEKIKGSPLPKRVEEYANAAGMGLLILLMILITIKDIGRFL